MDGGRLAQGLFNVPDLSSMRMTTTELLKKCAWDVAHWNLPQLASQMRACLLVSLAAEHQLRRFYKLKLVKMSAMSQEDISGLALININYEVAGQIYCPVVIGDFAVRVTQY